MNVISITSDLDALNKDMQDWSFLPMELKMRSNDECIRQYGMTVPSLYNKLRLDILKSEDKDIPSNIKSLRNDNQVELESTFDEPDLTDGSEFVQVDYNFGDIEKSRQLQQNPLIVIIDPTDNEEMVANKIHSYNALSEKFKRLSDSYSFELYGFNVRNMYKMVMSGIWTADADEEEERNTILVVGEGTNLTEPLSYIENFESVYEATLDQYIEAYMNHDGIGYCKIWEAIIDDPIWKTPLSGRNIDMLHALDAATNWLHKPATVLPWYTVREQFALGVTPNIDPNKNYLSQIKEAMAEYKKDSSKENANRLLELGWNYEVDITPESIDLAKHHYLESLRHTNLYDVRSLNEYDIVDRQEGDPMPVFFIFYNDEDGGGIRLSFESDLLRTVAPAGSQGVNLAGIAEVYVTFVKSIEDLDLEKFKSYKTLELYDSTIKYDHDIEKANKFIDAIVQMMSEYHYPEPHQFYRVYLVYKGYMSDYNYQRTDHIVDALLHHAEEICKDNNIRESCYFLTTDNPF